MKDERTRNKSVDKPKSEGGSYDNKAYSEKSEVYCQTEPAAFDHKSIDLKQLRKILTKDLLAKGLTNEKVEKIVEDCLKRA